MHPPLTRVSEYRDPGHFAILAHENKTEIFRFLRLDSKNLAHSEETGLSGRFPLVEIARNAALRRAFPQRPSKSNACEPEQDSENPERVSNRFADELTPAERAQGIRGIATLPITTLRRDSRATTEESANSQRPGIHGSLALM